MKLVVCSEICIQSRMFVGIDYRTLCIGAPSNVTNLTIAVESESGTSHPNTVVQDKLYNTQSQILNG